MRKSYPRAPSYGRAQKPIRGREDAAEDAKGWLKRQAEGLALVKYEP